MGKQVLPSGKIAAKVIHDLFYDKRELFETYYDLLKKHWEGDITDPDRLAKRWQRAKLSLAMLADKLGDELSDDAIEGFARLQKKLFKEGVDDADRWNDLNKLMGDLDTPQKRQSLNTSLESYKVASEANPDAKFWLKDMDQVQGNGYRYVTQGELDLINANGGKLPVHNDKGWYCSFDEYGDAVTAKSKLQLPEDASEYVARIEFSTSSVKDNIRVPFADADDTINLFEPLTRDFPDFGAGGGSQFLVDGAEIVVSVTPL